MPFVILLLFLSVVDFLPYLDRNFFVPPSVAMRITQFLGYQPRTQFAKQKNAT